ECAARRCPARNAHRGGLYRRAVLASAGRGGVGEPIAMAFGLPAGELALLIVALLAAGVIAGFLAGLLGIGGGGVLVPVLYEVFRVLDVDPAIRMHLVLG